MSSTRVTVSAMCSSILLLCLAAAAVQRASAADAGAAGRGGILHIPSADELARARCPSRCGHVEILYPFGIGPGCFRQGFELTCDDIANSPRLFLGNSTIQILYVGNGENGFEASAVHFGVPTISGTNTYNMSWEAPVEGVKVAGDSNHLYIVGCGGGVYLHGHDTNDPIGFCMSICLDDKETMKKANNAEDQYGVGIGWCSISVNQDVRAFGFMVGRLNDGVSAVSGEVLSNVKVFLAEGYKFDTSDIYSSRVDERNVDGAFFNMAITDQPSCASAQKNKATYACNYKSDCLDVPSGGYACWCASDGALDNPYIMGGCRQGYNPNSKGGCKRSCGNISIPFPFGLEKGCYALDKFRLNCTSENITILDRQGVEYIVANVSVNEGYLNVQATQSNSNYNDEHVIVEAIMGRSLTKQDEPLNDLLYLSEEFDMKMWWSVENLTCSIAMSKEKRGMYACRSANSTCVNVTHGRGNTTMQLGYRCKCSQGFEGNPYTSNGCKVTKHNTEDPVLKSHSYTMAGLCESYDADSRRMIFSSSKKIYHWYVTLPRT
ncbi:hypothetical protein ACQ4PT_054247 [Festuca glaucescens]